MSTLLSPCSWICLVLLVPTVSHGKKPFHYYYVFCPFSLKFRVLEHFLSVALKMREMAKFSEIIKETRQFVIFQSLLAVFFEERKQKHFMLLKLVHFVF